MAQLIVPKDSALTSQSAATRSRLIKTAEQLFSERGIERVSLQQINTAAGQKNKNAANYHFGDKRGLLVAILDKHQPAVIRRRDQLLDEMDAKGDGSVTSLVRALLYPMAEKLFDGDGGREYIRIAAELSASYAAVLNGLQVDLLDLGAFERVTAARRRLTQHLPEPVAQQRVRFAVSLILNGLADQSRALDAGDKGPAADTELLIRNLEDCLVALSNAPVSAASEEALLRSTGKRKSTARSRSAK
ncbi:MAG: TetR family transcriptional regulator [Panacagrimonas sp.]